MKKVFTLLIALLLVTTSMWSQTTRNVPSAFTNIQAAIDASAPGDIIQVEAGTLIVTSVVNVNKANITIQGAGSTLTKIQVSGTGDRFDISSSGVTIKDLEIEKTDKTGEQNIIRIRASNTTITNTKIHGQFVFGDGEVSRAMVINAGAFSGIEISNNEFYSLRQPLYVSGTSTGNVTNNLTNGTKGWVLEGGNLNFSGNTWGINVYDIAIISAMPSIYYTDIVAMSNANNGAVIEDQRVSPAVLSVVNVDASTEFSTDLGGKYHPYSTIAPAITRVVAGGTIKVAAGTYNEDVSINKAVKLIGAGSATTTISGPIGGLGSTIQVAASNVLIEGFTITRDGNNTTDWNNSGLNTAGIAVQSQGYFVEIRNNTITKMRTAIDINNSNGNNVHNNIITDNRTGMIMRNQTDNLQVTNNTITNNWTVGILFLDGSNGTNSPVQTAANCVFEHNNLSGNWYGQVVDRQTGGSLPAPGANMKNFEHNYWGTLSPVVSTANSTEPGYSAQIPVSCGGTAVAPGGQPDILGSASANIDYIPWCNNDFTNCNYANYAPITTIVPKSSPCGTLDVDVKVSDFNNVGAVSLVLNFDATKLQLLPIEAPPFQGVTLNPAFTTAAPSGNTIGQFRLGDFPVPAITLNDDDVLFTLHFTVLPAAVGGSTTALTWSTVSGECEYAGPGGTLVYTSTFNNNLLAEIPVRPVKNTNTGREYCNIQTAIDDPATNDLPSDRDVITVAAGTYVENININKAITLNGSNADVAFGSRGSESKIIPTANGFIPVTISSDNVTFNGFELSASASPYALSTGGIGYSNMTVKYNYIHDVGTSYTGNVHSIQYNVANGTATSNVTISYNKFDNINHVNNTASGTAIGILQSTSTGTISNLLIENNTISNVNSKTALSGGKGAYGIIINVGSTGGGSAISPIIRNNDISNLTGLWAHAIGLEGNTPGASITNNLVNNLSSSKSPADACGVMFESNTGAATVSVNNNSFTNLSYGIINVVSGLVNGTCNWYGSKVAADVSAKVVGPVTYISWLTDGFDNSTNIGFQPVGDACNGTPVVVVLDSKTDETCLGSADGTINITISGGKLPYAILWTLGGKITEDVTGLPTGTYNVVVTDANGSTGTLATAVVIGTVPDVTPPIISDPADVTVNQHQARDPYATGVATATDNCTVNVAITYNDNRDNLNLCNATGYIVRTWTATDAAGKTATSTQKITVIDEDNPVVVVPANISVNTDPGLCSAVVTYPNPTATDFGFFQGFEDAAWVSGASDNQPSIDWNNSNSSLTRVTSAGSILPYPPSTAFGLINSTGLPSGESGVFSRLGGYNAIPGSFGNGFVASLAVYLDLTDPKVANSTYGWDLTTAVSNQANDFLRDFIFHAAGEPGKIMIAADNNTNFARRGDLASINHYDVITSGWYTLKWTFRSDAGALAVDCQLVDAGGTVLWTETRSNVADLISTVVGGNRYMWFTFLAVDKLAIDNTSLTRKLAVTTDIASGTVFAKGETTVHVSTSDACGKPSTGSFTVTVADNEAPKITTCAPSKSAVVTTGCSVAMPDFSTSVVATDNCGVTSVTQVPAVGTMMDYQATPYTVTITVKDAANNSVACNTATFTVQKATLSGTLVYNNTVKTPMNLVKMVLKDATNTQVGAEITTTETGAFTFPNLCAGTYTIQVTNNNKDAGGINATDAAQVNAWSVSGGTAPIEHVKFLAGDVTFNKFIGADDALLIQGYFVFPGNSTYAFHAPKWSYWKEGELINSNTNPYDIDNLSKPWPTEIKVTVSGDVSGLELYGMLTGDFNGSLVPTMTKSAGGSWLTLTQNGDLQAGANQAFELPIVAASAMKVGAVSMILQIPSELVKVQDVVVKGSKDPVMWAVKGNELRIGWYSLDPVFADENTSLVTLKLMTTNAFTTGRTIDISLPSDPLNEIAEGNYMAIENAALMVARVSNSKENLTFGQDKGLSLSNYPNPFTKSTTIKYTLPVAGKVTINLYNNMGQLVTTILEASQSAGQYSVEYENNSLQPGIYVARLRLVNSEVDMVGTIKLIIQK